MLPLSGKSSKRMAEASRPAASTARISGSRHKYIVPMLANIVAGSSFPVGRLFQLSRFLP
jgi:hypothetical protein